MRRVDDRLTRYLTLSVVFHAVVLALALGAGFAAGWFGTERYEPKDYMVVEAIGAMPKSERSVPDRLARVKRAAGQEASQEPPPVKQSDLAFREEQPEPEPGNVDRASRQEVLDQLARERLLQEALDAPEGPQDRNATDPNGVSDLDLAVLAAGSKSDPEYMRWYAQVQQLMKSRFKPLEAMTQGRSLTCMVNVVLDPETGAVQSYEVTQSSGVLAFDSTAERVVQEFDSLPLPPEKYRPLVVEGVGFRFAPPAP